MTKHKIQGIIFKQVKENYKFLLLRRIPKKGGFWQPITGRVEKNETHLEALKREIKEETGITKIKRILEDIYEFTLEKIDSKEKAFGVEIDDTTKISLDKNIYQEHNKIKWCSFDEAIKLLKWPQNKKALENLNEILTK